MNGAKIRDTFLKYFEKNGHTVVSSSPLIPRNDPSLFFTNAGMVQFKNVFTGEEKRDYSRATSVQKCLRVSGKHNDLENVGVTPRHHTFFEMLGNFSFGDYFKRDAIRFGWELLTEVFGIDGDKLTVTVFREDDEAYEIWRNVVGIPEGRLGRMGEADNFWAMGDTGPCGPCSEIHIDKRAHAGKGSNPRTIEEDPEAYLEIWNLVFMQFERSKDGTMASLPRPSIDTGMGLERLAAVMQGKQSNYDTDLFMPIIEKVASLCGQIYGRDEARDVSMRVIADHSRAAAFLIGDGVMPSNDERGYVLRRIMRRAIRHGVKLGMNEAFLFKTVELVVDQMGEAFPEVVDRKSYISEVVANEEQAFSRTLDKGLRLYREKAENIKESEHKTIPGEFAFRLSDTYGFPLDLTQIIAAEDGLEVDEAGFRLELEAQREKGRKAWKGSGEEAVAGTFQALRAEGIASEFLGYETTSLDSKVLALLKNGARVSSVGKGDEFEFLCAQTPFYAESGGQIGDQGKLEPGLTQDEKHRARDASSASGAIKEGERASIRSGAFKGVVLDTYRPLEGLIVHHAMLLEGSLSEGSQLHLSVDAKRRNAIRRNHTATHLLHAALRQTLGTHVAQRGSLVDPDHLRFDFSHFKPLTHEELRQVETWVNEATLANIGLDISSRSLQEAIADGVTALFGEKYGDQVRVVSIPGLSAELCGGTHVSRTGDIGGFKIVSEGAIQAGVRRIEAVSGMGVVDLLFGQEDQLREMSESLKVGLQEVPGRVARLLEERKALEKEIENLKRMAMGAIGPSLEERTREVDGVKVLSLEVQVDDPKALREQADRLRDKLQSGVVVLGAKSGPKATILVAVTKDLTRKYHAGNIVRELARQIDGGGGGRPDLAQAGGKAPEKLKSALDSAFEVVERLAGSGKV